MPKTSEAVSSSGPLVKVAECLYRHESSKRYYALVKRGGKQVRRSLKTTDRQLANRRLKDFREQVQRLNTEEGMAGLSFMELAQKWFDSVRAGMKSSSADRKELSIRTLNKHFGVSGVRGISRMMCDEWSAKRGPQIAASTYNNERETLINILELGVREGIILENPAKHLQRRKLSKRHMLIPSHEQFRLLIETLREQNDARFQESANLVELLAYSGMRLGEATQIRWQDVDIEKERFIVTGGSRGTKNYEDRSVPLFPAMREFLGASPRRPLSAPRRKDSRHRPSQKGDGESLPTC